MEAVNLISSISFATSTRPPTFDVPAERVLCLARSAHACKASAVGHPFSPPHIVPLLLPPASAPCPTKKAFVETTAPDMTGYLDCPLFLCAPQTLCQAVELHLGRRSCSADA